LAAVLLQPRSEISLGAGELCVPAPDDAEGSLLGGAFSFADSLLGFALFPKLGNARGLAGWMSFVHAGSIGQGVRIAPVIRR
jgi:hypothetical protein